MLADRKLILRFVCLLVGCLTSQQHASVSQGRICSDNYTLCHTEIEVADQTFNLTESQYTDTWPTSPSADPITPGAWQESHWSANFQVTGMTRPRKNPGASGIQTRDLPLSRRTSYHKANQAVIILRVASKAADMAHLCAPQNQALGVCRGFVPDIQICGTHGRKDPVNATIISNEEEEEEELRLELKHTGR